ncbi:pilus assembly protein [Xanthomonas hyacinthi]|uniref:Pilus assembly protein n=1 Tax=Xanthomonas hyacinthi TaxID=56455 RepID=A0A2S7ESC5_9XANT|nr:PilX N-terminal domain-containing pilus assembly protein [Xanthomonas hyacinthi]KLD73926.1 pilus assembly protein [Xanthomonas hyacinthi DSM 19077]PPU95982.1 pilus assembly protein [Xanthomonas hyacinthi]QGY75260.1 pilus assembly protein [Xanthomonas hyacinthi]
MSPSLRFLAAERGASLVVVLILLLVMTLLGLAVLRNTTLEERMSANLYDRSLGFQAAESALRQAEAVAKVTASSAVPSSGCAQGVCSSPVATDADRWLNTSFTDWQAASNNLAQDGVPMPNAKYIIEYLGDAPTWPGCDRKIPIDAQCLAPRFRITALAEAEGRATVMLQTNYIVQ